MKDKSVTALLISCLFAMSSCGYSLRGSESQLFQSEGIKKVFVAPVKNSTLKPGVEQIIYNSIVRQLKAQGGLDLVYSKSAADAILHATVESAYYASQSRSPASRLGKTTESIEVTNVYSANLTCRFELRKLTRSQQTQENRKIWMQTFSRSRAFQANTRIGVAGTTASLINESEFDRALGELSRGLGSDVREAMVSFF